MGMPVKSRKCGRYILLLQQLNLRDFPTGSKFTIELSEFFQNKNLKSNLIELMPGPRGSCFYCHRPRLRGDRNQTSATATANTIVSEIGESRCRINMNLRRFGRESGENNDSLRERMPCSPLHQKTGSLWISFWFTFVPGESHFGACSTQSMNDLEAELRFRYK